MKNSVILKSYPNGISIILDDTIPYEDLLDDIAAKFREADRFFKDAAVPLSLKGRKLTEAQEREILDTITQNSHLDVMCLLETDEEEDRKFLEIQRTLDRRQEEDCGQFYRGTLKSGASIETEHSIIILGDVCSGSRVYSSKDIIVLGALLGDAHAGAGGGQAHFIAALDMSPGLLRIGDLEYHGSAPKNPRWGFKPRTIPKIAYVRNGGVQIEPITKELLDAFAL